MGHHTVTTPFNDVVDMTIIHRLVSPSRVVRYTLIFHAYRTLAITLLTMTMLAKASVQYLAFLNISLSIRVRIAKRTLSNADTIFRYMVKISKLTTGHSSFSRSSLVDAKRIDCVESNLT